MHEGVELWPVQDAVCQVEVEIRPQRHGKAPEPVLRFVRLGPVSDYRALIETY